MTVWLILFRFCRKHSVAKENCELEKYKKLLNAIAASVGLAGENSLALARANRTL